MSRPWVGCLDGSGGHGPDELVEQFERGFDFGCPLVEAGHDVAGALDWCDRFYAVPGWLVVSSAGVGIDSAGAGDVAEGAEFVGLLWVEDRRAGESFGDEAVGKGEVDHVADVSGDVLQSGGVGYLSQRGAFNVDSAAEEPVAGGGLVEA